MQSASISAATSLRVGLYRCGTTPSPMIPLTAALSPATCLTMSVTMPTVLTTVYGYFFGAALAPPAPPALPAADDVDDELLLSQPIISTAMTASSGNR